MPSEFDLALERALRPVTKERVLEHFEQHGFTMNERLPFCGFIYFPTSAPFTKENRDQGRVFWTYDKDKDEVSVSASWGRPTDAQFEAIQKAVALYATYRMQSAATPAH